MNTHHLADEHRAKLSEAAKRRWAHWRERNPVDKRERTRIDVFVGDLAALERLSPSKPAAVHALVLAAKLLQWRWDGAARSYIAYLPDGDK